MMRLLDRYLVTLVVLLGLAGGLAYLPARMSPQEATRPISRFPMILGEWVGSYGAPSDLLPSDPRAKEDARWTYRNGNQVVWVAVGLYDSRNDPQTRPSINLILPGRDVSGIERTVLPMQLNGAGETSTPVNQIIVTMATARLGMLYWYQLGPRTIADEYRFRLALFLNTLRGSKERLVLVRVATVADVGQEGTRPSTAEKFLRAFYPVLMKAVGS